MTHAIDDMSWPLRYLETFPSDHQEGKNFVEFYVPDHWVKDSGIKEEYYEKVEDVIDVLIKNGLANTTDIIVLYMMILLRELL